MNIKAKTRFLQMVFGITLLLITMPLLAVIEDNPAKTPLQTSVPTSVPIISTAPTPIPTPATSSTTVTTKPAEKPTAKIIGVKPHFIVKSVAQRVCRDVPRTVYYQGRGTTGGGAVLGGIAGGVIGSQIGGGRGNTIATIGGAVLGAAAGNQIERNSQGSYAQTEYVTICKTIHVKKSVRSGYEVTYSYNGKQGTKIMKKRPVGDTIPLKLIPAM